MTRKILSIIFIIIILIGVSGCMKKQNKTSVKEEVENYMKEKYNEEFKVVGGGTESWNDPFAEIYVLSEKFPNATIMVRRARDGSHIMDNYMGFLLKSEIEQIMSEIVSEIYPESKVFYSTYGTPRAGITKDMNAEEYLKYLSEYGVFSLTICISDPDYEINKDRDLEQLREKFREREYKPSFTIFYVLDGKLDLIDEDNERDLYTGADEAKWSKLRGDFDVEPWEGDEWREINE